MVAEAAGAPASARAPGRASTTGLAGGPAAGRHRRAATSRRGFRILQVQPKYTTDAMVAKIQGSVRLSIVVHADGTVGDVKVVESLDTPGTGSTREQSRPPKPGVSNRPAPGPSVFDVQVTLILDFRLH